MLRRSRFRMQTGIFRTLSSIIFLAEEKRRLPQVRLLLFAVFLENWHSRSSTERPDNAGRLDFSTLHSRQSGRFLMHLTS